MVGLFRGFSGQWMLLIWSAVATASWAAPTDVNPANATLAPSSPITLEARVGYFNVSRIFSMPIQTTSAAASLSDGSRTASSMPAEAVAAGGRNATVAYIIAAATSQAVSNFSSRESAETIAATRPSAAVNASAATVEAATTTQSQRNYSATTERRPASDAVTAAGSTTATQRPSLPLFTVRNTTSNLVTAKSYKTTAGGSSKNGGSSNGGSGNGGGGSSSSVGGGSATPTVRSSPTSSPWTTLLNHTGSVSSLASTTRSQTDGQRVSGGPTLTPPFSRINLTAFATASQAATVVPGGVTTVVSGVTLRNTVSGGGGSSSVTAAQFYSPSGSAVASRNTSSIVSSASPTFRPSPTVNGAVTHSNVGQSSTAWTPPSTRRTEEAALLTSLRASPSIASATSTNSQTLMTSARTARLVDATIGATTPALSSNFRSTLSAQASDGASVESSRSVTNGAKVTAANTTRPLPAWEPTTSIGSGVRPGPANVTAATQPQSPAQISATRAWTATALTTRVSASAALVAVNGSGVTSIMVSTQQSPKLTTAAVGGTLRTSVAVNSTSVTAAASEPPPTPRFSVSISPKSSLSPTAAAASVSSAALVASRSSGGPAAATTLASSVVASATTVTSRPPNVTSKSESPAAASVLVQTATRALTVAPSRADGAATAATSNASLDSASSATRPHSIAIATMSYSSTLRMAAATAITMTPRSPNASDSGAVSSAVTTAPPSRSSGGNGSTANPLRTTSVNATSAGVRISTAPPSTVGATAVPVILQSTAHMVSRNNSFGSTAAAATSPPSHPISTTQVPSNATASVTWASTAASYSSPLRVAAANATTMAQKIPNTSASGTVSVAATTAPPPRSSGGNGSTANSLRTTSVNATSAGARISTQPPPTVAATAEPMNLQSTVPMVSRNSFGSTAAAATSPPSHQISTTQVPSNATASATRASTAASYSSPLTAAAANATTMAPRLPNASASGTISSAATTAPPPRSSGGNGSTANSLRTTSVHATSAGARISTQPPPTVAATAAPMNLQSTVYTAQSNSSFSPTWLAASSPAAAFAAAAATSLPSRQNSTTPASSKATASATPVTAHSPPQPTTSANRTAGITTHQLSSASTAVTTGRLYPVTLSTVSGGTALPSASAIGAATTTHNVSGPSVNGTLRKAIEAAGSTTVFLRTTTSADSVNSTVGRPTGGLSSPPSLRTATVATTHPPSLMSSTTSTQTSRTTGAADATAAATHSRNLTGGSATPPRLSQAATATAAASTAAVSRGVGIVTTGPPERISSATNATLSSRALTNHLTATPATVVPSLQSTETTMAPSSLVGGSTVVTSHTLPPPTRQSTVVETTRLFVGSSSSSRDGSNSSSSGAGGATVSGLSSRIIATSSTVFPGTFTRGSNVTLVTHLEGGGSASGVPSLRMPEGAVTTVARQPTASAATTLPASAPSGAMRSTAQNAASVGMSTLVASPSQPFVGTANATRLPPSPTTPATAISYSPVGRPASGAATLLSIIASAVVSSPVHAAYLAVNATSVPPLGGTSGSWLTRVPVSSTAPAATTAAVSELSVRAAIATTLSPDGIRNSSGGGGSSSAISTTSMVGSARSSSPTSPVALPTIFRAAGANQSAATLAPSSWSVSGARATSAAAAAATELRINSITDRTESSVARDNLTSVGLTRNNGGTTTAYAVTLGNATAADAA